MRFIASDWVWLHRPVLGYQRLGLGLGDKVLLLPIGRGFTGQCLDIGGWDLASTIGGRVPEAVVTFEPREKALGAWQEVKGEAMPVNEALYAGAIEGTIRLDGS